MFRGHADEDWQLLPKAGRKDFEGLDDLKLFYDWRRHASSYVERHLDSEWEWLALAQHHGLATRLLDWTVNPLAAAFLAVIEEYDKNGALFCFIPGSDLDYIEILTDRIDDVKKVLVLRPPHVSPRIIRQVGRFTIHPKPSRPLTGKSIKKLIISKQCKNEIQDGLNYFGINHAALFPDLDGVSRFLNWFFQRYGSVSSVINYRASMFPKSISKKKVKKRKVAKKKVPKKKIKRKARKRSRP